MKNYKILTLALCALFILGLGSCAKTRTPTETLKALNEASKKKDPEAIKKLLSKGTLKLLDDAAQKQKMTSDELLKKEDGAPFQELPEIRGEKIEGDTAIVEVKNTVTNDSEKIPLVKEDGEWKVALDKYLDEMKKKFEEEMKKIGQTDNPSANSNTENDTESNKK